MKVANGLIFLVGTALLLAGASCETGPGSGTGAGGARSGVERSFLRSNYPPLNAWLDDERFEVDYKHMTPQLVFDQVPLNDIHYEIVSLPAGAPAFNFSSADVSRRELLRRIAEHWNLKMSLVTNEQGQPTAVRVEG